MKIEMAWPGDVRAIYALTNELEDEILPWESFQDIYERVVRSERELILAAREKQAIIGYVHVRFTEELHHGGVIASVQEMIVEKEYRGQHIGRALFAKAMEVSKERGALALELTSHFSRKPAHQFYESMGLEKTSYKFVLEFSSEDKT